VVAATDYLTGLTQARLKELLHYDPETGVFTWLVWRPNGVKVGDVAGVVHGHTGYLRIKIDRRQYAAGRLAWLYMTGAFPAFRIDHEDTDKLNNRWCNLRPASASQNAANRTAPRNNTSGYKGVHYTRARTSYKKWAAHIRVDGVLKTLGYFSKPEEAHAAYVQAARAAFGQYARS
jgi:hypothetical protein